MKLSNSRTLHGQDQLIRAFMVCRRDRAYRPVQFASVLPGEVPGQYGYVLWPLPQRRCDDRENQ